MIHRFSAENFFSIADKQTLDLTVAKNVPDSLAFRPTLSNPKKRVPLVVGLFGANASGKTTVLKAIVAAKNFVENSFSAAPGASIIDFSCHSSLKWAQHPTKIVVEFDGKLSETSDVRLMKYELHIGHDKIGLGEKVLYEALYHSPRGTQARLFERHGQSFKFSPAFGLSEKDPRADSIRPNASVISTLAQFNHDLCVWLKESLSGVQTNLTRWGKDSSKEDSILARLYDSNPEMLDRINKELRRLDIGLESMQIDRGSHGLYTKFRHMGLDRSILMVDESMGTRNFLNIFPMIYFSLQTGAAVFLDEIDSDLHPLLIPEIFSWFYDTERNPNGAQLFFTGHNAALLDFLSKEQIYLVEKNIEAESSIYGLRDISGLRRGISNTKKYLSGELGAIPNIG
jgi:uncharacterized protein